MTDTPQEKWMKGVAITATVLAVLTAAAASRGAAFGAKIQLLTATEGSQWGYYQAKSIKQNILETQAENFKGISMGTLLPEQKKFYEDRTAHFSKEIERYDKEKAQIKAQAEETGRQNALYGRKANQISLSIVLFQVAIMLSSVSGFLKRKELWLGGVLIGVVAAVYLANGLFLFF